MRHVEKQTTPQRNFTLEPMQPFDRLPGTEDRKDKIRTQKEPTKVILRKFLKLQPKIYTKMPRLHSGAATDRPEITRLTIPPIPEVVWQQPQETHVPNIYQILTNETHKSTQMPESKQRSDVESQTSPMKETSSQESVSSTEPLPGNQTRSTLVQSLNDSNKAQPEIQQHERNIIANDNRDDSNSPPKITTSQIEDQIVRNDTTNEL